MKRFWRALPVMIFMLACDRSVQRFAPSNGPALGVLALQGTLADGQTKSATESATPNVTVTASALSKEVTTVLWSPSISFAAASPLLPNGNAASGPWQLSGGDGDKVVYAQLSTESGIVAVVEAHITLDSEAPVWRQLQIEQTEVNTPSVTFDYDAVDDIDGPDALQIAFSPSGDPTCADATFQPFGNGQAQASLGAPASGTTLVINACVRDRALNLAPFAKNAATDPGVRTVYFDNQAPATPLLNAPINGAGGLLLSWIDPSNDSAYAVIEASPTSDFASPLISQTAAGTCRPTRAAPPSQITLTDLTNLQNWFFRVHLVDCAGNAGATAETNAIIGAQSTSFASELGAQSHLQIFGNDLYITHTNTNATGVLWGPPPGDQRATCFSWFATINHCDAAASDCASGANWTQTNLTLGPPKHGAEIQFSGDDPTTVPCAGEAGAQFACPDASSCSIALPRVTLANSGDHLWMFASLSGVPYDNSSSSVSDIIVQKCAITNNASDCDAAANWTAASEVRASDTTRVFGAPAAWASRSRIYVAHETNAASGAFLSLDYCTLPACTSWTVLDDLSVALQPVGDGSDSIFAPTLGSVEDRAYAGVSLATGASVQSACNINGSALAPALVRCSNACTKLADLTVEAMDNDPAPCATPPSLQAAPSHLLATWRAVDLSAGAASESTRAALCPLVSGCQAASDFSAPTQIGGQSITPSELFSIGAVAVPEGAPVAGGNVLRVLSASPHAGTVSLSRCDESLSDCSVAANWVTAAVQSIQPDANYLLSAAAIASNPLFLIVNSLQTPVLLQASVPTPERAGLLPRINQLEAQWSGGQNASRVLEAAPASPQSVASIDGIAGGVSAFDLAAAGSLLVSEQSVTSAGTSDPTERWQGTPFSLLASVQPGTDRGLMSLAVGNATLSALSTTDSGLVLYSCPLAGDCSSANAWTNALISTGSDFAESAMAADVPRDATGKATAATSLFVAAAIRPSGLWLGRQVAPQSKSVSSLSLLQGAASCAISGGEQSGFDASRVGVGKLGGSEIVGGAAFEGYSCVRSPSYSPGFDVHFCSSADTTHCDDPAAWSEVCAFAGHPQAGDGQICGGTGGVLLESAPVVSDVQVGVQPLYGWTVALAANAPPFDDHIDDPQPGTSEIDFAACKLSSDCTNPAQWSFVDLPQNGAVSTVSLLSSTLSAPLALGDESRDLAAIAYRSGADCRLSVCTDAATSSAWPCASGDWSGVKLATDPFPPLATSVAAINGDVVAYFLSSQTLTEAICPLGERCEDASSWFTTQMPVLANFATGFSAGRSVPFTANDGVLSYLSVANPSSNGFGFNFLIGGGATILR